MIECSSLLGPYIQGFLSYREALFHKNSAYEPIMKSLDRFCAKRFPCSAVLTQEMVLTWMEDSSGSHSSERTVRGSVIRKFAMYMNGIGGAAYVLPEKMYGHTNAFVPYIFTDDELIRLFAAIDRISPSAAQPYKQEVLPVMFRLIYTCGLRPAEARTLKTENIYLDSGEVLITGTKRNKDRIVVMSEDMRTLCVDYNERRTRFPFESDYFFPRADGEAFASITILREFQRCWKNANPDIAEKNLPFVRVYDLRHRFATAAVQRWLDDGSDLNAKLPFLRAYMGHDSFAQTAYYIHLLPANLTQSTAVDWAVFDTLIPEVCQDAEA